MRRAAAGRDRRRPVVRRAHGHGRCHRTPCCAWPPAPARADGPTWPRRSATASAPPHHELAHAAFAFEDHLWSPALGGWLDLRFADTVTHAWCSGSAGIGLTAAEQLVIDPTTARHHQVLSRAATACWNNGMGWTHTLCHGDFGNRELLHAALAADAAPPGLDPAELDARLITSLERLGPICGVAGAAFPPGLLTGISGIAYQLLRMHRDCPLPSVLRPPLTSWVQAAAMP